MTVADSRGPHILISYIVVQMALVRESAVLRTMQIFSKELASCTP